MIKCWRCDNCKCIYYKHSYKFVRGAKYYCTLHEKMIMLYNQCAMGTLKEIKDDDINKALDRAEEDIEWLAELFKDSLI